MFEKLLKSIKKTVSIEPVKVGVPKNKILDYEKQEIQKYSDFLAEFGNNIEQKRAVVSNSKRILVLAGAGSGKTKVLTKRFIHLVKNKNIPKDKILAVTFTRVAANEMRERIAKSLNTPPDTLKRNVRTFHSFCLSILKQNEQFDIIIEKDQRALIQKILYDFCDGEEIMQSMYDYIKDNLIEKIRSRDQFGSKEPQVKGKPTGFGEKRIKTASAIYVRSKSERDIANFLTFLNLNWEYEQPAEWADGTFYPDFTVEDDIYIEHWCYNDKTPEFKQINKQKYLEHRRWKEEQFKKHNKTLISIEEHEMLDLQKLQNRLKTQLKQLTKQKFEKSTIFDTFKLSKQYEKAYEKFVDELVEIINLAKSRFLDTEDIQELIKNQEKEKILNFYAVLIPVMKKYEIYLRKKEWSKKDFNDLIKHAVELLKSKPERCEYYRNKIKYLLIDEFQDVSFGEVELLKLLIDENTALFAVGDDWQSIYGWRGSDVNYILNFQESFGKCEKIILPVNYRCTKNIVEASNKFIQSSKRQYKKNISCCKEKAADNSKIIQVNAVDDFNAARYVLNKIRKLQEQDKTLHPQDFLILYRSSRNIHGYTVVFKETGFKIARRTIHWAKGTEAKYVFVLGLKGGMYGFPNVYADKDIKRVILDIPVEDKEEEERRLFYVAMTRAKNKLFLISENANESEFVKELPEECKFVYSGQLKQKTED